MAQFDVESINTMIAATALLTTTVVSTTVTAVLARRTAAELATVNVRVGELERTVWTNAGYQARVEEEKVRK